MDLCSIASGSSGNCIYVGNQNTKLLVDAGISGKRIEHGLYGVDVDPGSLDGILVTHEHIDHVGGLGVMARRYHVPIYGTAETLRQIQCIRSIGKIPEELFRIVEPDKEFVINDVTVNPFSISHDASNPVCYTLTADGCKAGIATDLGKYDEYIISKLAGAQLLLLEANHDVNMLQVGSYPYTLKRRILGDRGHLSNDNSGRLICRLLHHGLKHVYLGHLSKENNYPDLAYETVRYEVSLSDSPFKNLCRIEVAKREEPSVLVTA